MLFETQHQLFLKLLAIHKGSLFCFCFCKRHTEEMLQSESNFYTSGNHETVDVTAGRSNGTAELTTEVIEETPYLPVGMITNAVGSKFSTLKFNARILVDEVIYNPQRDCQMSAAVLPPPLVHAPVKRIQR